MERVSRWITRLQLKWYTLAAEQGLAGAQFKLGYVYDIGKGVQQD